MSISIVGLLFWGALAFADTRSEPIKNWSCGEMRWTQPSQMLDGVFHGELEVDCELRLGPADQSPALKTAIVNDLKSHRTVHGVTLQTAGAPSERGTLGELYDVTHELKTENVSIRERIYVGVLGQERLFYRSESQEVKAAGMAGYLKKVSFESEVLPAVSGKAGYRVRLKNAVQVERPWFALSPMFHLIAKGVSKEKFEKAQTVILGLMERELLPRSQ